MMNLKKKGKLGSILAASRIITESDVTAALEEQARTGCRLGEALVNLGIVSQEDVDWALSNQLDIPYIRLKRELIDPEATSLISAEIARKFVCIPLFLSGNELNIAIADPLNRSAIEYLELNTGLRVSISVAVASEILEMIEACYGSTRHESLGFESSVFSTTVLDVINSDLSGAKLLDGLLISIIKNQLTSLSLQPLSERVMIRGRRTGLSRELGFLSLNHYADFVRMLQKRASIVPGAELASEGIFFFEYRNRRFDFHLAYIRACEGDYITLRLEAPVDFPEKFSELELPEEQRVTFGQLARAERGITFFASHSARQRDRFMKLMLEEAKTSGKNVLVLGDSSDWTGSCFARVPFPRGAAERTRLIGATLDHDLDILVIQELDSGHSMNAACKAAIRGVRVLAGLDLRSVGDVLRHLLFCQQYTSSLSLLVNGIISTIAVRRLCPECRKPYQPTPEELSAMGLEQPPDVFYHSSGCDVCGDSGFKDRRILLDAVLFNDELRQIFRREDEVSTLEEYLRQKCHFIAREGTRMLAVGELSPEEYIIAATD